MFKSIWRAPRTQEAIGGLLAGYLRFVHRTTRWVYEPARLHDHVQRPAIIAMWHGQHFLVPFARPHDMETAALISRHGDGEVNAIAVRRLGSGLIRGSGGHGAADKTRKRGGAQALRKMLDALKSGVSIVMTADVPKVSQRAGEGIVLLAKLSGCPIYPVAVITKARVQLKSWDRAVIALPFSRGAMVVGQGIYVAADADSAAMEEARQTVERELDAVHARAYALAGGAAWRRSDA